MYHIRLVPKLTFLFQEKGHLLAFVSISNVQNWS